MKLYKKLNEEVESCGSKAIYCNGVNMKVISTKRTMPVVWLPFLGSWIFNEFENSGKWGSAPGKQNLRVTCPMGEVEFKCFSSPDLSLTLVWNILILVFVFVVFNTARIGPYCNTKPKSLFLERYYSFGVGALSIWSCAPKISAVRLTIYTWSHKCSQSQK